MFSTCHICQKDRVEELLEYRSVRRITSDCKIWQRDGRIGFCHHCGSVQKLIDSIWDKEIEQIYNHYEIYYQSQGEEQIVLSNTGGRFSRSYELFRHFFENIDTPLNGHLLDMGCGNGSLLHTFNTFRPGWKVSGVEIDDKHRSDLEKINGFDHLYTKVMPDQKEYYNLITMVHFLEHVAFPKKMLRSVNTMLKADGYLLIQVPVYQLNPFDLLIADHGTHFTQFSLKNLLIATDFEIVSISHNWIQKELSVVARRRKNNIASNDSLRTDDMVDIKKALNWLNSVAEEAASVSEKKPFGLFGTSIAASWLFHELNGNVDFFADEDKNRVGRKLFGRSIQHPENILNGAHLFIGLAPSLAEIIFDKYKDYPFFCYKPQKFSI